MVIIMNKTLVNVAKAVAVLAGTMVVSRTAFAISESSKRVRLTSQNIEGLTHNVIETLYNVKDIFEAWELPMLPMYIDKTPQQDSSLKTTVCNITASYNIDQKKIIFLGSDQDKIVIFAMMNIGIDYKEMIKLYVRACLRNKYPKLQGEAMDRQMRTISREIFKSVQW